LMVLDLKGLPSCEPYETRTYVGFIWYGEVE
jgi:hypothetical protein